jgi:hypothetical protein
MQEDTMKSISKLIILAFWFLLILSLSACCDPIYTEPTVDASPLQELILHTDIEEVSDVVEPHIFDFYETNEDNTYLRGEWKIDKTSDYAGVSAQFVIYPDAQIAQMWFADECSTWSRLYETGGGEENPYCISYKIQYRLPPDSFCKPDAMFYTDVVFRKGRLMIHVQEVTGDENSIKLSEAIEYLAEEIEKHLSEQP